MWSPKLARGWLCCWPNAARAMLLMSPKAGRWTEHMAINRVALPAVSSRIDVLEAQLAKGKRRINEQTIDLFGDMQRKTLRSNDSTPSSAYLEMFVSNVSVPDENVVISRSVSCLKRAVSVGLPVKAGAVSIFDREWCPEEDKGGTQINGEF